MTWSVLWSDKSKNQLKKIDKKTAKRIVDAIEGITEDPFMAVSKLTGSQFFRLRMGNYRIIMDLQQSKMIVFVVETDNRKRIYK